MLKCPTCDGAMVQKPVLRCVRCGEPNPAKDITLEDLIAKDAQFFVSKISHGVGHEVNIHTRDEPCCKMYIGHSGVYFAAEKPRAEFIINYESKLILPIDFERTIADSDYWDDIRRKLFALVPAHSNVGALLWKRSKERRMQHQAKSWRKALSPEIVAWADGVLSKESEEDDCVDNYRVACTRKSSQMRRYEKQRRSGCCGSADFVRVGPDGQKYVLGYNFGH